MKKVLATQWRRIFNVLLVGGVGKCLLGGGLEKGGRDDVRKVRRGGGMREEKKVHEDR